MTAPPAGPYQRANGGTTVRELQQAGGDGTLLLGVAIIAAAGVLGAVVGWFARGAI